MEWNSAKWIFQPGLDQLPFTFSSRPAKATAETHGHGASMDFGPCNETLDTELLHVLASGDEVRMADLLGRERRGHGHSQSQVAIRVDDDDDGRAPAGASRLLGVTTGNGN